MMVISTSIEDVVKDATALARKLARADRRTTEWNSRAAPVSQIPNEEYLTDTGNGKRLARKHGRDIRYCHLFRKWFVWRDTHWQPDDVGEITARAKRTILDLFSEAKMTIDTLQAAIDLDADDDATRKRTAKVTGLLKWAQTSQQAPRIQAMIQLAQSEHGIPVTPAMLDTDPMVLNVSNGMIDLRTGELRPHRREDYLTKLARVKYDPSAKCPLWERSLAKWMQENDDLITYLQRAVGYSLTASVKEQVLFFLFGDGRNGKSTFLGALLDILGDYAMQGVSEMLLVRGSETHPTERADLFGRRFVATIETEDGKRMAEALLKQLTGGDRIRARRMREDFWEFSPTHKIWLAANHKPQIRGTDLAVWRRIKLIPFTVTIADEEKDPDLPQKLLAEAPGILAWAVRGCLDWQAYGLGEPDEVRQATAEYQAEQDLLRDFLEECCVVGPDYRSRVSKLFDRFRKWCDASGEREMTQKKFGQELTRKGFEKYHSGGTWYIGIDVRNDANNGEAVERWKDA